MSKPNNRVRVHKYATSRIIPANIVPAIKKTAGFVFERENNPCPFDLTVILTSDSYIKSLNIKYLSKNRPTDVLCFPYPAGHPVRYPSRQNISGDIYISVDTALRQSREYSHTLKQEILFLVIHGILHLLGWDDKTMKQRNKMCERQEYLLHVNLGNAHGRLV